ncbi:fucose 4-O-acetylase-like acetyltransferase [Rhodococcus sp. LBL1]|nr:fucose 4-O-acetylase-like acetyltransferase [Rhodococcus sp. LBL1]MDH6682365.1 fucose 4-O-acetylase-like acetyltransferase [Rhodococcus sp. LBL2]
MTTTIKPDVRKRDVSVDSLRGLAVILMVAGHVIGSVGSRGMQVPDDSLWRYVYLGLEDIRMPLFTVLSGYVYGLRPVRYRPDFGSLVRGKIRRLLVPMVTVGLLLFGMQLVTPGTNSKPEITGVWRIFAFGFEHLWFLQAIFVIFLIVGVCDVFGLLGTPRGMSIALAISGAGFVLVRLPSDWDIFSINGVLRLLPFFLLGYALRMFPDWAESRSLIYAVATVFLVTYGIRALTFTGVWPATGVPLRAVSFVVGLCGVLLLYFSRNYLSSRWLAWIGAYSFGIYLLHVFGAAATRIVLDKTGVGVDIVVFVTCLAVGVLAPIAAYRVFGRFAIVRQGIFGEK